MKIFLNGFWGGFESGITNSKFFFELLENVFDEKMEKGSIEDSDILFESVFSMDTLLYNKKWKYTFLFSGESDRRVWNSIIRGSNRINTLNDYTCILKGEKNNKNIINLPLFVYYNYCFNFDEMFKTNIKIQIKEIHQKGVCVIPKKGVCVIVSNGHDSEGRNYFFEKLEKRMNIDYAGEYKNNVPRITHDHCSQGFIEFVSQYKFIIAMENSKNETYITEKILHGFCANTVPIYWGSDYITEYFNEERFINVKDFSDRNIETAIDRIVELNNDDGKYLEMINKPIYVNNTEPFTIKSISNEIKSLIGVACKT